MSRRGWHSGRTAEGATVKRRKRRAPMPTTCGCTGVFARPGFDLRPTRLGVLCLALMLFPFRRKQTFRTAGAVTVALVLLTGLRALAEGSSAEAFVLLDAGQPRRFEIARDELHCKDRNRTAWVEAMPAEPSVERLRARAASLMAATGMEVKLVMYPAGSPRNQSTRRLLTQRVLVRLMPEVNAASILGGVPGIAQWQEVEYLPGAVLVEAAEATGALALAESLRTRPG